MFVCALNVCFVLLSDSPWCVTRNDARLDERTSVLLLGDSLGDLGMANGLPAECDVLAVGFLVAKSQADLDKALPLYASKFDVVVTSLAAADATSFAHVLDLLASIE